MNRATGLKIEVREIESVTFLNEEVLFVKLFLKLGMVGNCYNLNTQDSEAGGLL